MLQLTKPEKIYAELFVAVQSSGVLGDSKTFVDAIPKSDPQAILDRYRRESAAESFDLLRFVHDNFELPETATAGVLPDAGQPVREHIEKLWDSLARDSDTDDARSSLIGLPRPYIVPGGRFREIYYWDSYFTLLGLAAAGRRQQVEDMVTNFAYLIDTVGFIPNGNRSYFCSRSQPPYFAMMVELLAELERDDAAYQRFLPQLGREYAFWMAGAREHGDGPRARAVPVAGGWLNRYWDEHAAPRPESYAEDRALADAAGIDEAGLFRNLRAACESGWDFSSRWLADAADLASIRTTEVVPVDLNALLYKLESVLAHAHEVSGDSRAAADFRRRADARRELLQRLFFCERRGLFTDLLLPDLRRSDTATLAAAYPLFLGIASEAQAARVAAFVERQLLRPGGWVISGVASGQQWDAPNGWAPLEWVCYRGLLNYGFAAAAREGATRWVRNNLAVYADTGRLMEKYDVETVGRLAGGGEYGVQDGFGWTNGVLLRLLDDLEP
ncbi:MAG TPA: alpha,alpha-trehalase TreF [Woeseiaceae bacterium]|nr:alpha,alpha-trehalase TreF [Woeseiaceae bacterium]